MRNAILLLFAVSTVSAQTLKEKELKTKIQEVTVFLDAAQIFESGSVPIPSGKSTLRVKNISPFMDEKSIQVKAEGNFTILSINHRFNYLQVIDRNRILDSLISRLEGIQASIAVNQSRIRVLNEKEKLLEANRTIEPTTGTVASLKAMLELYDTELTKINEEELRISKATSKLQELESSINNQLQEQNKRKILPTSEIEIRVETKTALNAAFSITYLVSNAGWYPKYDVRVTNITKPPAYLQSRSLSKHRC
jgi:uncharacterized protein (TIGR02231 family)